MNMKARILILFICILLTGISYSQTQNQDTIWTLEECINYAFKKNIQVRKSYLTNSTNEVYTKQAKAARLPSLNASINQNFGWNKLQNTNGEDYSFSGNNNTNYSLNSSLSLFNGLKINNKIKQAELDFLSGKYNSETIKESISLSILNAFLQVLYAEEQVKNSQKQIEATTEQLNLAKERLALSIISQSDYFQVKAELASEKLTLANVESQLAIARVNLMQLMDLPVVEDFAISHPDMENVINQNLMPNAQTVYNKALVIKPQVKNAELNKESTALNERIAKADFWPRLSLNAGIGTGYSTLTENINYGTQLNNQINPSVGLSLSIPIFQNKQIQSNVEIAKIGIQNAELDEIDVKNQLRKDIEQACVDVNAAETEYEASLEQYKSIQESYLLANEKFNQGLINSVDFLFERTNLIVAESQLLQSKYNLIFSYKILDFYSGVPLTLD